MLLYSFKVSTCNHSTFQYDTDVLSVATLFRHTPLVRFSRHTEQCRQQLLVNENGPGDVWLCHLVSLRQITEEASLVFELDDSASTVTFSDAKSQFQLASLDQQLKSWRDSAPKLVHDGKTTHILSHH